MRRNNIFWGLLIIFLGVLFLLEPLGILPEGFNIWNVFWPMVLILLGLYFLLPPLFNKNKQLDRESLSIPLDGSSMARIRFKHGAGRLHVKDGASTGNLLEGSFVGGVEQSLQHSAEQIKLKLRTPSFSYSFPGMGQFEGLNWNVSLSQDIPLRLDIESGASESILDLSALQVRELNIDTGASSTEVTLPENAGMTKGRMEVGAGSIKIRVPANVAARITTEASLAGVEIDTHRFHNHGGYYQSEDYETAENKATLHLKAGVGSLEVR